MRCAHLFQVIKKCLLCGRRTVWFNDHGWFPPYIWGVDGRCVCLLFLTTGQAVYQRLSLCEGIVWGVCVCVFLLETKTTTIWSNQAACSHVTTGLRDSEYKLVDNLKLSLSQLYIYLKLQPFCSLFFCWALLKNSVSLEDVVQTGVCCVL